MLLVIDVGNTNTVLGLYDGEELLHDWRIRTVIDHTVDEYGALIINLLKNSRITAKSVRSIIISCVVPPMLNILDPVCQKYFGIEPLIVGPGVKTGMPIFYDNPREVGADRIVNAVAAYEKYRREMIIVDFGTATTFDYISPKGEYMGGCIAPGIMISSEALFERAAKLPRVELCKPRTGHHQGHGERHAGGDHVRLRGSRGRDRRTDEERNRGRGVCRGDRGACQRDRPGGEADRCRR